LLYANIFVAYINSQDLTASIFTEDNQYQSVSNQATGVLLLAIANVLLCSDANASPCTTAEKIKHVSIFSAVPCAAASSVSAPLVY